MYPRFCKKEQNFVQIITFLAGWRSELAGCRSTLSMSKVKVRISETNFRSFYKTLVLNTLYQMIAIALL